MIFYIIKAKTRNKHACHRSLLLICLISSAPYSVNNRICMNRICICTSRGSKDTQLSAPRNMRTIERDREHWWWICPSSRYLLTHSIFFCLLPHPLCLSSQRQHLSVLLGWLCEYACPPSCTKSVYR